VLPSEAWRPGSGTARRQIPGCLDINVVDGKWRLLVGSTALYSLGLQCHFRLLTSQAKCYWLSGEGPHISVQRNFFRPPSPTYPHFPPPYA